MKKIRNLHSQSLSVCRSQERKTVHLLYEPEIEEFNNDIWASLLYVRFK